MAECEFCGKRFLPSRWWQRFDTKECQQAWNRRRYRQEGVVRISKPVEQVLRMAGVDVVRAPNGFVRRI